MLCLHEAQFDLVHCYLIPGSQIPSKVCTIRGSSVVAHHSEKSEIDKLVTAHAPHIHTQTGNYI